MNVWGAGETFCGMSKRTCVYGKAGSYFGMIMLCYDVDVDDDDDDDDPSRCSRSARAVRA